MILYQLRKTFPDGRRDEYILSNFKQTLINFSILPVFTFYVIAFLNHYRLPAKLYVPDIFRLISKKYAGV